jgi:hypothetical protein
MLIINLILAPNFQVLAGEIEEQKRTDQLIEDFMKNSKPSDLPFLDYEEDFRKYSKNILDNFDLSKFLDKKIYVGYGIFDQEQKYCKYIEEPTLDPNHNVSDKISSWFNTSSEHHFNQHSYIKSLHRMTYNKCKDLVSKFGGYVATPTTSAENTFLSSHYVENSSDKIWIGLYKADRNTPYYNEEGHPQDYKNWSSYTSKAFDYSKRNVSLSYTGKWFKEGGNNSFYCVMETDSPDIKRPIKFCAPWWRIERDYKKYEPPYYGGINLYQINQADIPKQTVVCTKYDRKQLDEVKDKPKRTVTCTEYYQSTIKPECLNDPMLPQCFIDECSGYIKNACKHKQEIVPYKDYTKTKISRNGSLVWVKDKVHIRTQVYECPPALPSKTKACLETATVIIYPKECPGSQCEDLKECVLSETNKDKIRECYSKFKCQKIYGSPDLPVFDAGGNLTALKGYCQDKNGHNIEPPLEFPINIQNKHSKKCLEYERIKVKKTIRQKCLLERPYQDYTVEMSLTDEDIYENNPNCIRINNLFDARPAQKIVLNYINNGFSDLKIKKALIDGNQTTTVNAESKDYVVDPSTLVGLPNTADINYHSTTSSENPSCPEFTEDWFRLLKFRALNATVVSSKKTSETDSSHMMITYPSSYDDITDCSTREAQAKGDRSKNNFNSCNVWYKKSAADRLFRYIQGDYNGISFQSENEVTKDECERLSKCLGGAQSNTSTFNDGRKHICVLYIDQNSGDDGGDPQIEAEDEPVECKPETSEGVIETQFDGNKDIFYIESITKNSFGYYSNYSTWDYKENVVGFEGKEIFPLIPITSINDNLVYKAWFKQTSIRSVSPNILAGTVGGATAGAASYGATTAGLVSLSSTGIGAIAVAVFVIVAIIFASRKKYNEQENFWIIYKMVPVERYVENIYGYDQRIVVKNSNGFRKVYEGNKYKLIYAVFGNDPDGETYGKRSFTGTLEPSDFKVLINNWFKEKKQLMMCMGWEAGAVPHTSMETSVVVSYPGCSWWNFWCDKHRSDTRSNHLEPFVKKMTVNYQGAVNTLSIFVPYQGDYKIQAFDKNDKLLGEKEVYQNEFLGESGTKASYAQVMFGITMDLASGISEGTTSNACRYDNMVEWGGGVSGVYYENDFTGMYNGCQKSNDSYVQDHSAVKFKVMPLNSNKAFVIELDKPLPFANRVILVTLGMKEVRKYRCYEPFGECLDDDFEDLN